MEKNLFRIGAFYRQRDGRVVQITEDWDASLVGMPYVPAGIVHAVERDGELEPGLGNGARFLTDGRYVFSDGAEVYYGDLVPGELHKVGDEWVPIESPSVSAALEKMEEAFSKTPTLDKLESGADLDGKRAPLPYFREQKERAKFDPFKGFVVYREDAQYLVPGEPAPFAGLSLDGPQSFRLPQAKF